MEHTAPQEEEAPKRVLFHEWLSDQARGSLNQEATFALAEVVQAVADHGKPGTLTISIKVTNAGSGNRTVVTAGTITKKLPKSDSEVSIFFVGDGGTLHREDPYQERLPGTAVELPADTTPALALDDHEEPNAD